MATYQFKQDNWAGGMSQDLLGGLGTVYYAKWLNLKTDKHGITLNSKQNVTSRNTGTSDEILSGIVTSNTDQAWCSSLGYVYDYALAETYRIQHSDKPIRNALTVSQDNGANFGVFITDSRFHRYPTFNGIVSSDSFIVDGSLFVDGSWSKTGGWTISSGLASNSWSAGDLSQTTTCLTTTTYRIAIEVWAISGSVTFKMWGTTLGTVSSVGVYNYYRTTAGAGEVFLAQTTDSSTVTLNYVRGYISNVTESVISYTATGNDRGHRPVYVLGNDVYFGAGSDVKVVSCLNSGWTLLSTKLEIGRDQEVTWITRIGDLFYVYANDGYSGYQYLWDGSSVAPERVIKWQEMPIRNVANFGNYDIVVCSKAFPSFGRSYIFKSSGYSRGLLYQSGFVKSDYANDRFMTDSEYTNAIETVSDICVIPANKSEHGDTGMYGFWKYNSSYPESISKDFSPITGTVTAVYLDSEWSYLNAASFSGQTKYITSFLRPYSSHGFASSGYLETNPMIGGSEAQLKEALKYRIGYLLPHSSTSVKVYYRLNSDTSWTLHQTISTASSVYSSETYMLGDAFNRIQFKIEWITSNSDYSPTVFDFTLEYKTTNTSLGN